jgi:hypothetical protein
MPTTKKTVRIDPAQCSALYLRVTAPGALLDVEKRKLREQLQWEKANPELTRAYEALAKRGAWMLLARRFEAIDGTSYPKSMGVQVVTHWGGNLIVYSSQRNVLLTMKPGWVRETDAEASPKEAEAKA